MSCGGWASRFCLGISCLGPLGSQNPNESSGIPGNNSAANGPPPPSALHPSPRVNIPGEAGPEHGDAGEKPGRRGLKGPRRLSLLGAPGPSVASFANFKPRILRANSLIDDQGPTNTEMSVAAYDVVSRPLDNTNAPPPLTKMGQKQKAITFAKGALQVAAEGLRLAPIPNLDQIPNILLALIQTYEVSHLAESLPNSAERPIQMLGCRC